MLKVSKLNLVPSQNNTVGTNLWWKWLWISPPGKIFWKSETLLSKVNTTVIRHQVCSISDLNLYLTDGILSKCIYYSIARRGVITWNLEQEHGKAILPALSQFQLAPLAKFTGSAWNLFPLNTLINTNYKFTVKTSEFNFPS